MPCPFPACSYPQQAEKETEAVSFGYNGKGEIKNELIVEQFIEKKIQLIKRAKYPSAQRKQADNTN